MSCSSIRNLSHYRALQAIPTVHHFNVCNELSVPCSGTYIPAMKSAIMHSVEKKGDCVIPTTPVIKKRLKTMLLSVI